MTQHDAGNGVYSTHALPVTTKMSSKLGPQTPQEHEGAEQNTEETGVGGPCCCVSLCCVYCVSDGPQTSIFHRVFRRMQEVFLVLYLQGDIC